jgi:NAD-dependent SIR2 family protein deacetylase
MVDWPDALIREIADRRAIIFVGAGISKNALPGMPSWEGLLRDLSGRLSKGVDRKLVRQLLNKGKMLDAAQIITDDLDRADLNAEFRRVFQIRPTPQHEIYNTILQLDLKTIITTNYDEFLEKNFDHYSGGVAAYNIQKYTSKDLLDQIRSPQRTIVKMHGCITEPNDIVLDRTSYFDARYQNHGFFSVLSALFLTNTVLFIGYSLSDPDLQVILENIHGPIKNEHCHYCLISKLEHRSMVQAIKKSYNIKCLEYRAGNHHLVQEELVALLEAVNAARAARGTP